MMGWLTLGAALPTMAAALPNVILLMMDDQGWGDVGYNTIRCKSSGLLKQ